jgi:hypothetical protein
LRPIRTALRYWANTLFSIPKISNRHCANEEEVEEDSIYTVTTYRS